ncbi:MAG: prenyltransferase/squalene oxidase repeat-containing protein [Candidatus Thorarchaeota archaeon]
MSDWTGISNASAIPWLLERNNSPVRYYTLLSLLGYSQKDSDVVEAKKSINSDSRIIRILSKQNPEGFWESSAEPYLPKYKSSYWQVMILGMLGLDKSNPNVKKAVEHVFKFQHPEGGFTEYGEEGALREYHHRKERMKKKGREMPPAKDWIQKQVHDSQLTCLTGNMCLALIRLGYSADKRVKRALDWLMRVQNEDGGWLCPYWNAHAKDKHGCFMGTITPLDAFSEIPSQNRTAGMTKSMESGIEFLLMHHLFRSDHHDFRVINESWLTMGFPQFFYDILRGLSVICKSGYGDDRRIDQALEVLIKKQHRGTWVLESSPVGRMQTNLEQKNKPSKWITLKALEVIKSVQETRGSVLLNHIDGSP